MTLRDKMLAVIADTNASVAEREELVEMIAISLLTRKNLFVLGEPGQAKSYAINLFRRHITGARQFERLLSKQSDEEQLFGRVDLASLLPGSVPQTVLEQDATYQNQRFNLRVLVEGIGSLKDEPATWEKLKSGTEKLELYRAALSALHKSEPAVQTAGKIPEADIVLLDEIFKCNDGVLNSLLTALNERKYTNEGRTYPIPVISFFAASNEIPNFNDPQEKILEALYDRLELKVVTANMEDRDTRLAVLKNKQTGAFGQISATITLEELVVVVLVGVDGPLDGGAVLQGGGGLVRCDLGNFRIVVVEAALELIVPAPDVQHLAGGRGAGSGCAGCGSGRSGAGGSGGTAAGSQSCTNGHCAGCEQEITTRDLFHKGKPPSWFSIICKKLSS